MQLFRKKQPTVKRAYLCAVGNGRSGPISGIPDEAFSSGMLGVGYALEPQDGLICSPVDGRVLSVAETEHAYSLYSDDGLDILVHIGVDTVELHGQGFDALVKAGQTVHAGEPLARADLALIREKGLPTVTAVLITDPDRLEEIEYQFGDAHAGKTAVMHFTLK